MLRTALALGVVRGHLLILRKEHTLVLAHDGATKINLLRLLRELPCRFESGLRHGVSLNFVSDNERLVVMLLSEEKVFHIDSEILRFDLLCWLFVILSLCHIF